MNPSTCGKIKFLPHHKQQSLCTTRPSYRQGRKLTAVKVYTVNDESVHLLIHGVPSIGLLSEVSMLCERYGRVKSVKLVDQYSPDQEEFTNVYHVQFERIQAARFAKKILDNKSFFGGVLHVCYAPELETVHETKLKLVNRKREIARRSKYSCNDEIKKSDTIVTNNMDEESFKTSYEDKFSLGSTSKSDPNNASIFGQIVCSPSTSQDTSSNYVSSPIVGPIGSSNDHRLKTQPYDPTIISEKINAPGSFAAQKKKEDLKNMAMADTKVFKSRKRSYSDFISNTLHSANLSQPTHCSESLMAPPIEKKKISKISEVVNRNFSYLQKRPNPNFNTDTQPHDVPIVTQQTSHPEVSTQNTDEKLIRTSTVVKKTILKQPHSETYHNTQFHNQLVASQQSCSLKPSTSQELEKTIISDAATSNKSLNSLKPPVVGPIRFIPRSLSIKKKKV